MTAGKPDRTRAVLDRGPNRLPPMVITSVALGVASIPALLLYAIVFTVHGLFVPTYPPDIGGSRHVEAGWAALVTLFLVAVVLGAHRYLVRLGRLLHLSSQFLIFGLCVVLVLSPNAGERTIPVLLGVCGLGSIVSTLTSQGWNWIGERRPSAPSDVVDLDTVGGGDG